MNRFIIRHLTGAKANQETAYTDAELAQPLTLGRDPSNRFVFDDADDAVSREHARIERDAEGNTKIVDLDSANGTYVNRVRVSGEAMLKHGDIVQFGRGGPQASIRIDPPPAQATKATRLVSSDPTAKATRVAATSEKVTETSADAPSAAGAEAEAAPSRVGRATVERLITAEKSRSTRLTVNIVAGVLAIVGALGAWQFVDAKKRDEQTAAQMRTERDAAEAKIAGAKAEAATKLAELDARTNLSKRVKAEYGASTVYIESSWRLTETATGKQIYHAVLNVDNKGTMPAYLKMEDGSYEPMLEVNDRGRSRPIGNSLSGTGFVVSDNGLIMTNRHVAAAWHAPYELPFPGIVVERRKNDKGATELVLVEELQEAPQNLVRWIPSRSQLIGSRGVSDATKVTGTVSSMTVTFPNSKLRTPATLGTISPEHDVALIKIEASTGHLKKVQMLDRTETLASGDAVAVLGYPAVSGKSYAVTASSDTMLKAQDVAMIPEVSVNQGIVSKATRSSQAQNGLSKVVSMNGDTFEMSINSTGQGNSGGPVFDSDGKVIGIFSVVYHGGYATQSSAVPIRYGLDLLDPTRSATSVAAR